MNEVNGGDTSFDLIKISLTLVHIYIYIYICIYIDTSTTRLVGKKGDN